MPRLKMSVYHHGDTGENGRVLFHSVHGLPKKGANVYTTSVDFSSQLQECFLTGGLLGKVKTAVPKRAT